MDNNIIIAFIGVGTAFIVSIPGVLAYFNQRKLSKYDATQKITDAAIKLVEPLQTRIELLEKENKDLKKQLTMLTNKNTYIVDLEFTKNKLEEDIAILTSKLEIQGRMIQSLIDAIRCYIKNPSDNCDDLESLLSDMEKQENNVRNT